MKYEEYQVWYHTYNTAIGALLTRDTVRTTQDIISIASSIADVAVQHFKNVEDKPQVPSLDVQGFVNNIMNDMQKKKK